MATAIEFVQHFRQLRALVIGDAMLDTYMEGTATRLCSEGPIAVVHKTTEHRVPGGAANTAANIRALEADVMFLSVVGTDHVGGLLRTVLRERGINDCWLVQDERIQTQHKVRILADGQYVVRFDEGNAIEMLNAETQQHLLHSLETVYPLCDVVVISDYCYGVMSDALIARLYELHERSPKPLLIDSKALQRFWQFKASVVTPNYHEARLLLADAALREEITLQTAAGWETMRYMAYTMLEHLETQYVAITLAEHGVLLAGRQGQMIHMPAHPVVRAYDIGAGDTFAAALALSLAAGAAMPEAVQIALDAASIAVSRRWTAVVQQQELLQRVSVRVYGQQRTYPSSDDEQSRLALARLVQVLEHERSEGRRIVFTNGVFDILHAGHIQFLRQAKALGDVLVVGINSDSSTRALKGPGRPLTSARDRLALVAALDMVDHVILFDEETPAELIRVLRPDVHVKGGDYAKESLPEAEMVYACGGRIVILPLVGSMSTSAIIDRIARVAGNTTHGDNSPEGKQLV